MTNPTTGARAHLMNVDVSTAPHDRFVWENGKAGQRANAARPLTRSLDYTEEGLAVKATRDCSVTDCTRKHYGRGLCKLHWRRFDRTGSVQADRPARRLVPNGTACEVAGCNRRPRTHGLCPMHYERKRTGGDLTVVESLVASRPLCEVTGCGIKSHPSLRFGNLCAPHRAEREIRESLTRRIDVTGCCWLWTGHVNERGYGMTGRAGTPRLAHRAVFELLVGPIPTGLTLDHLCRVRNCVNPDHLQPVSASENVTRANLHRQHSTELVAA